MNPKARNALIIVGAIVVAIAVWTPIMYSNWKDMRKRQDQENRAAQAARVDCPKGQYGGEFRRAVGNIYADVSLYQGQGPCKTYVGKIIGGNKESVLIKFPDSQEWKNRDAVQEQLYVDPNEKAVRDLNWREIEKPN